MRSVDAVDGADICCENCRFYAVNPVSVDFNTCNKHAPKPVTVNEANDLHSDIVSVWPRVLPDDWCGEFEE